MFNKLLALIAIPIINFSPAAQAASMAELKDVVHETREVLVEQREKIKQQLKEMGPVELEKVQNDTSFLEGMVMYIKLQEALEVDLMFLELETAKYVK